MIFICCRCANWRRWVTRRFFSSSRFCHPQLVTLYEFMHGASFVVIVHQVSPYISAFCGAQENIAWVIWIMMTFYLAVPSAAHQSDSFARLSAFLCSFFPSSSLLLVMICILNVAMGMSEAETEQGGASSYFMHCSINTADVMSL